MTVPSSVIHNRSLLGERRKWLGSGFLVKVKRKMKVLDGCSFALAYNARVPLSVKTGDWMYLVKV